MVLHYLLGCRRRTQSLNANWAVSYEEQMTKLRNRYPEAIACVLCFPRVLRVNLFQLLSRAAG